MATFQEMKAKYESPEKKGFVGNVLSSMSQPFRRALEAAQYAGSAPGGYTPMFKSSSAEDINAAIREPSKQVVKSIASAGSFLVPGGGGKAATALGRIGTAAAKGAGAGLLSGYGLSESGEELESTLKGGAIGGAFGGGLQAGGELVSKLGKRVPKNGANVKAVKGSASKIGMSPKEFADDITGLLDDMKARGYDVSSSKSIANSFKSYLSEVGKEVDDFASIAQGTPDIEGIRKFYTSNLKYIGDNSSAAQKFKDITDDLLAKPNPTYGDLVQYTRELDKVGGGFKRVMKDSTSQLGQVLKDIRGIARDASSTSPEVSGALQAYSRAANLESTILKNPEIANTVYMGGILPFSKTVNIRPITEKFSGLGSKLYNATIPSQTTAGVIGKLSELGQRAIPAIAGIGASSPDRVESALGESLSGGMQIGIGAGPQKLSVQEALSLAQQIMPNASESETMSLAKMLMTEASPDVSVASISAQGALADIAKLVNIISENNGVPFSSALPFGGFSEEGQVYKNAARNVYDLVTRTRTGAALNQSEEEFYKQFVPGITDTPASIQDKIKRLQDLYSSLAGEVSSSTFFPQQQISDQYGDY